MSKSSLSPRSQAKQRAILDAAQSCFLEWGFGDTSVDAIAAAAGVSKQTVYAHFGSKNALLEAMVENLTDVPTDHILAAAPEFANTAELGKFLEQRATRQIAEILTPQLLRLRRLLIAEATKFPQLGALMHQRGPAASIGSLAEAITHWHRAGLLVAPVPQVAAEQLNWLVLGAPLNNAMFLGDRAIPSPDERDRHARAAVETFLAAYGPGETQA